MSTIYNWADLQLTWMGKNGRDVYDKYIKMSLHHQKIIIAICHIDMFISLADNIWQILWKTEMCSILYDIQVLWDVLDG